jgi:TFIIF-interacting CTD phosphatase-like protein
MKDLSMIEPNLANIAILDNSPGAYELQPANGIPIKNW